MTLLETIQQGQREFERMKLRKFRVMNGLCATCGARFSEHDLGNKPVTTHSFDTGIDAACFDEVEYVNTFALALLRAVVEEIGEDKDLEAIDLDDDMKWGTERVRDMWSGRNEEKARLRTSLTEIINKLEKR